MILVKLASVIEALDGYDTTISANVLTLLPALSPDGDVSARVMVKSGAIKLPPGKLPLLEVEKAGVPSALRGTVTPVGILATNVNVLTGTGSEAEVETEKTNFALFCCGRVAVEPEPQPAN